MTRLFNSLRIQILPLANLLLSLIFRLVQVSYFTAEGKKIVVISLPFGVNIQFSFWRDNNVFI